MSAMNVVHMRAKPGKEDEFVEIHKDMKFDEMKGARSFSIVRSGDRNFIVVGEWDSMEAMIAARPVMVANLDRLRPLLEDLGGGRGVTEPWSGNVVLYRRGSHS